MHNKKKILLSKNMINLLKNKLNKILNKKINIWLTNIFISIENPNLFI